VTIYLVRHAHAGSRHDWAGHDDERPLTSKGRRQAHAITGRFGDRRITRVLSSPSARCVQTVEPIAEALGVPVEHHHAMAEGADVHDALELLRSLAHTDVVLCSHGDVIPELISALAARGVKVNGRRSAAKGATYVIEVDGGEPVSATYIDP
jgi:phosphohistidine phosphatase SixA